MPNVPPALTAIERAFRVRGLEPMQYFDNRHLQPPGLQDQFNAPPTPHVPIQQPAVPAVQMPPPMAHPAQAPMAPPQMPPAMPQQNVTDLTQQLSPAPFGPSAQLPGLLGVLSGLKPRTANPGSLANIKVKGGAGANALGKAGFTPHKASGTVF